MPTSTNSARTRAQVGIPRLQLASPKCGALVPRGGGTPLGTPEHSTGARYNTRMPNLFVIALVAAAAAQATTLNVIPPPADVAAPPGDATKTKSGLASKVITPGSGSEHPSATDFVSIHYTGWTTDGKMFDSSVSRGKPATFRVDRVIPGFSEGLQLMTGGEKRRLWIPESLAYKGQPATPAGTLVFDLVLMDIPSHAPPD